MLTKLISSYDAVRLSHSAFVLFQGLAIVISDININRLPDASGWGDVVVVRKLCTVMCESSWRTVMVLSQLCGTSVLTRGDATGSFVSSCVDFCTGLSQHYQVDRSQCWNAGCDDGDVDFDAIVILLSARFRRAMPLLAWLPKNMTLTYSR